jgi:hypothetical protein
MKIATVLARYKKEMIRFQMLSDIVDMRKEFQISVEGAGAVENQNSYI